MHARPPPTPPTPPPPTHVTTWLRPPVLCALPTLHLQGDALGRGQLHLHPAWLQLVTADGQLLYLHRLRPHVASPNFYTAPVGGTCGGFL